MEALGIQIEGAQLFGDFYGEYVCQNDKELTLKSDVCRLSDIFRYTEGADTCSNSLLGLVRSDFQSTFKQRVASQLECNGQVELFFPATHKDGAAVWVMNRGSLVRGEDGQEYIKGILIEMTRTKQRMDNEKEVTDELQEQTKRDSLTGIYNAKTARNEAEEYLEHCNADTKCALLVVDMDYFKQINDQHGHLFGDAVLVQAAQKIRNLFRAGDVVGRIGGDEFMVLMKDISDKEIVKRRCIQLNEELQGIFDGQDTACKPTCSIGVAFLPDHGDTYFHLFCCADQALYTAKDLGRKQYVFYNETCGNQGKEKRALQFADYDENMLRGYIE